MNFPKNVKSHTISHNVWLTTRPFSKLGCLEKSGCEFKYFRWSVCICSARHSANQSHLSQKFVSSFVTFGWFIWDWNCIRYLLWCTNTATCRPPLCSQLLRWCFLEIVYYLPRSRCGILGSSSSGDPWRTHCQNPPNEQRPHISGDPPRKVWTPPTLQIRHQTGFIAATWTLVKISLENQKLEEQGP